MRSAQALAHCCTTRKDAETRRDPSKVDPSVPDQPGPSTEPFRVFVLKSNKCTSAINVPGQAIGALYKLSLHVSVDFAHGILDESFVQQLNLHIWVDFCSHDT